MKLRSARTLLLLRAVLYLLLGAAGWVALRRVAVVIAPVGVALFLAYLLNPLVERLEARRLPRPLAVALLLLAWTVLVAATVTVVPPLLRRELAAFGGRWREAGARLDGLLAWAREGLIHFMGASPPWPAARGPAAAATATEELERIGAALQGATGDLASAALGALDTATGLLRGLLAVALVPVFTAYFLVDFPRLRRAARELVPPRHREPTLDLVAEVNHALASWLRGQLTVMLILGTLYATGLTLFRVPLGLAIGLLTGLLAFVPYVGVVVGLCLALAAAVLDAHPASAVVGALATFGSVQALDAMFITPRVLGGRVGLSPVAVIFALMLGGELGGYVGVLLAVPAAAVAKVLLGRAHRAWVGSAFYNGAPEAAARPTDEQAPPRSAQGG
jgi:predicted PurR-regulated permease PerM